MVSRRQVLKAAASGTVALGLGEAGILGALQPRRHHLNPSERGWQERFLTPLHVGIIGGGLAGLSAALELAERGAKVTLFEAAPHWGGKLGGWSSSFEGRSVPIEHGFHGFFSQYYNLNDTLDRLEVTRSLVPVMTYPLAFRHGATEVFGRGKPLFPLNLLSLYLRSKNLHLSSLRRAGERMTDLLTYHPQKTFEKFDQMSFAEYCANASMDPALANAFLIPFAKTTLNHPTRVSAAYALRFMHFYFIGNPEGLSYRISPEGSFQGIIEPWVERLRSLGVFLRAQSRVARLEIEGGKVKKVVLQDKSEDLSPLARFQSAQLIEGRPLQVGTDRGGVPLFAWKTKGQPRAVRGACTHQGCPVRIVTEGFACPCHGGQFNLEGLPVSGPPKAPLEALRVSGNALFTIARPAEAVEVDHLILAADVRGSMSILKNSNLSVGDLAEADPYLVMRIWLSRRADAGRESFYTLSGYRLLDSVAFYDAFQPQFQAYAQQTGHGVVELHAYAILPADDHGPEANANLLIAEFREAFSEFKTATVLHREVQQNSNFSGYAPGSDRRRPGMRTALPNLLLAGDWVKTDLPVTLMEGAVTAGRMAANAILSQYEIRTASVVTVPLSGILAAR